MIRLIPKTVGLIAAISTVSILLGFCLFHLNEGSLDLSNRDVLIIVTDSMDGEPQPYDIQSIPRNSLIMTEWISEETKTELEIGDVVGFRTAIAGGYVFHRIQGIDLTTNTMTLKGDNSRFSEEVSFDDIDLLVKGVDHVLGEILLFVKLHLFFVLTSVIAVAVLICSLGKLEGSDSE